MPHVTAGTAHGRQTAATLHLMLSGRATSPASVHDAQAELSTPHQRVVPGSTLKRHSAAQSSLESSRAHASQGKARIEGHSPAVKSAAFKHSSTCHQTIHPTHQPLVNKCWTTHTALSPFLEAVRKWRPVSLTLFERGAKEAYWKLSYLRKTILRTSERQGKELRYPSSVLPLSLQSFAFLHI